jgi:hypothetical protein
MLKGSWTYLTLFDWLITLPVQVDPDR